MDDLQNRFAYHRPPSSKVGSVHSELRTQLLAMAEIVCELTPPCREQSVAITKLEEAMMWANAAVARHHEHYAEES